MFCKFPTLLLTMQNFFKCFSWIGTQLFHPGLCSSSRTLCTDLNSKTQSFPLYFLSIYVKLSSYLLFLKLLFKSLWFSVSLIWSKISFFFISHVLLSQFYCEQFRKSHVRILFWIFLLHFACRRMNNELCSIWTLYLLWWGKIGLIRACSSANWHSFGSSPW